MINILLVGDVRAKSLDRQFDAAFHSRPEIRTDCYVQRPVNGAEVMEKGLNTELYWNNNDPAHTVSMVPTSAITGEGIPDLLLWLVKLTQVRRRVKEQNWGANQCFMLCVGIHW